MTSLTCDVLKNEITCFQNQIQSCCSSQLGPVYFENYKGQKIDWHDIIKRKLDALEMMKNGIMPSKCAGCFNLKPYRGGDFPVKFTRLIISSWVHCNCSCIYCARNEFSDGIVTRTPKRSDYYDMLPVLKGLYENNLLNTDGLLFVDFQGGDISVLSEFNEVMDELIAHNAGFIRFTTNNIVYQPRAEIMLKMRKAELMTSLDCGCRETYKKIKRVDKFEDAVNNLRTYKQRAPEGQYFVKYITVEGINDNEEEVNKFLDLMSEIGVNMVNFELDYRFIMMHPENRFDIPKHYYKLLDIFRRRCAEENLELIVCPHTKIVLKQGYFGGNS